MPLPESDKKYTYTDYLTWSGSERWEIIDGMPYMQAAPTWQHQAISAALLAPFYNYLAEKPCQVFASPFDLRLPDGNEKDEETTFVVQPDIVVVCDQEGLKGTGYFGTPTLVIEISSPSTSRTDKIAKFNRYEKAGVKEYWIVEPEAKFVSVFILQPNKKYGRPEFYTDTDKIRISLFSDFELDLKSVFKDI